MYLSQRGIDQVSATHDFVDALPGIVYGTGQMIGNEAVGTAHDEIAAVAFEVLDDAPLNRVVKDEGAIVDAHPQRAPGSARRQSLPAGAGIPAAVEIASRARARENGAVPLKRLERGFVGVAARTLVHNLTVPMQFERFKCTQDRGGCAGLFARRIEVIDPHQPTTCMRPCLEKARQRRHYGSEM